MLVFVHINKTAGSTLRSILRGSYGWRHCDVEPWDARWSKAPFGSEDLRRVRRLYPHLASIAGHRVTGYVDLEGDDLRYLTVLREPLKLGASRFQYRVHHRQKHDMSFERWIEQDWVGNPQTQRIAGTDNAADAIDVIERTEMFLGLTERFDESMVLLASLLAPDLDTSYESVNVATDNSLANELLTTDRSRKMLQEANRADLQLYGYVRDELYPRLQRAYGPTLDDAVGAYQERQRGRFDRWNVAQFRAKQHLAYAPIVSLSRRRWSRPVIDRLL